MDFVSDLPSTMISLLSSEGYEPTSALQFLNSQLVSHGFARSPGLSLDGLGNTDGEKLVKCVLGMLGQRVEDVRRTEELCSKLRTLTYENERVQSMHQTAIDSGANAEREMHAFKSKLAASEKSLAHESTAHKQTLAELQRTRTSLQHLRSTTQNELKRKDRELERVMERWNKVSDVQAKLLVTPSGVRCANFVAGTPELARGPGLMEQALEQAEELRGELVKENDAFRTVLLNTANTLQNIIYTCECLLADVHVEEVPPLSHPALFAPPTSMLSQPENAYAKLRELFAVLRNVISKVSLSTSAPVNLPDSENEIKRLNELITSLRTELQQSRQSSSTLVARSQALLDRFTTHVSERLVSGRDPTPEEAAEMSLELMSVPERDQVRAKLEARAVELKKERERFTEATVKLGKERAELEADRMKMLEEKRRWAVEQMLTELPSTPGLDPDLLSPPKSNKTKVKQDSPSPSRIRPRKAGGPRILGSPWEKTASQKRTRGGVALDKQISREQRILRERRQSGVFGTLDVLYEPDMETEDQPSRDNPALQRSTTPEDSPPIAAPTATETGMKTSLPLVLSTTFTLPPPSPASCFTTIDLRAVPSQLPTMSQPPALPSQQQQPPTIPNFNDIPLATKSASVVPAVLPRSRTFPPLRTPHTPHNTLLKHAYSPIRPSPLSRILMLADSPLSPPSIPLIQEEHEVYEPANVLAQRALARELGPLIDEPSPLRERAGGDSNGSNTLHDDPRETGDEKRFTLKEKSKGRAVPIVHGLTASEKENAIVRSERKQKVPAVGAPNARPKASRTETKRAIGPRSTTSKPLVVKGSTLAKTSNECNTGPSSHAGTSTTSGNMELCGAKRVPISGATTGKSGTRRA